MFDNGNPKVIVDDDFLDLRNDRKPRVRPQSSNTRVSSSLRTQANANTIKDVFPGLKRIINSHNQKHFKPSSNIKSTTLNIPAVDSRFRRKIEKRISHSRPESIHNEKECTERAKEMIERKSMSHSSEPSTNNLSSGSEKQDSAKLEPEVGKPIWKHIVTEKVSRINKEPNENDMNGKNEEVNKICNERKDLEEHSKNLKSVNNARKAKKVNISHHEKTCPKGESVLPLRFCTFPTFKKSWTIPSIPLMPRSFSWTRHPNMLCNKVDRETYEFDTDDTISDSEDKLSLYSTISKSNYINLIFCLGCLCGIFLVGGILTASEIQVDYFKPVESDLGILIFFYEKISYTLQVIFGICYQILIFPTTSLFRMEQPRHWSFFDKFLYFLPE